MEATGAGVDRYILLQGSPAGVFCHEIGVRKQEQWSLTEVLLWMLRGEPFGMVFS